MRSSLLTCIAMLLFLSGCNGLNSEGNTIHVPGKEVFDKPQCHFKTTSNCWTKSIAKLQGCLGPTLPSDVDIFKDGKRYCSNSSGKLIVFPRPFQLVDQDVIEFEAWNKSKCFHFIGSKSSFVIDAGLELGKLSVETKENGDIQVQCFNGESFSVPSQAVEKGCRGASEKTGNYIPKASLFSFQEVEDFGYQFVFRGTGSSSQTIFKCYE